MLNKTNIFNSKPEFDAFAYTNLAFDKVTQFSASTRTKEVALAVFSACIFSLAVSIDLMTVSFRIIKHINALSSYKTERFHIKEFLNKNYEKIVSRLGFIDIKELEYKQAPLTNRLIEKIEKLQINSKIRKVALRLIAAITVQFTLILDALRSPFQYYNHKHYVFPNLIRHIKSEKVKYRRLALFILSIGAGIAIFKNLGSIEKILANLSIIDKPIIDKPIIDKPIIDKPIIDKPIIDSFSPENQVSRSSLEKLLKIGVMVIPSVAAIYSYVKLKIEIANRNTGKKRNDNELTHLVERLESQHLIIEKNRNGIEQARNKLTKCNFDRATAEKYIEDSDPLVETSNKRLNKILKEKELYEEALDLNPGNFYRLFSIETFEIRREIEELQHSRNKRIS